MSSIHARSDPVLQLSRIRRLIIPGKDRPDQRPCIPGALRGIEHVRREPAPAWKLAEDHGAIAKAQLRYGPLEGGPSETLVPMDLIEIQPERPHQFEPGGAGAADCDGLAGEVADAPDGLPEKILQRVKGYCASTKPWSARETPLRFVHHIPRNDRLVTAIALDDGAEREVDERQ